MSACRLISSQKRLTCLICAPRQRVNVVTQQLLQLSSRVKVAGLSSYVRRRYSAAVDHLARWWWNGEELIQVQANSAGSDLRQ
jgi:hypothetical protein